MAKCSRWMFSPTGGCSSAPEKRGDREARGECPAGPRPAPLASLCLMWLAWWCPLGVSAAENRPKQATLRVAVDPRVELVSILFRLAGNPEYGKARVDSYSRDVEQHFGRFRSHPAVEVAKRLRQTRGVSFDAPMAMAVHLTDAEKLQTKLPLEPWPESLDARWTPQGAREFLDAARQFVRDAKFQEFFDKHRLQYALTESRMRAVLDREAHLEWFAGFFGERPNASFTVVLGMLNGGQCYGPHCRTADGKEELYCVLGVWKTDAEGRPQFDRGMVDTIVHEFCHSYTNSIVDRHAAELKAPGEKIYPHVADALRSQAYGNWKTMLYESLVRACVVRYTRHYDGEAAAQREIDRQKQQRFLWIGELSDLLGQYEDHREQYASLEAFSPRIVKFFSEYADKFVKEQEALDARRPKIVSMTPAGGATGVDPDLAGIEVVFDRPMKDGSWSMVGGGPHFPETTGKPAYDAKGTTWSVPVRLKPDWSYELMLNAGRFTSFRSREGVPLDPVTVKFTTAKKSVVQPKPPILKPDASGPGPKEPAAIGSRHAMIVVGHPGDAEHEEIYAGVVEALTTALTGRCRFSGDHVLVWCGTKPLEDKRPSHGVARGPATWESIQAGVGELRKKLKPEDTLWVFVLGHAHFDGRRVFLNLPGPDADAEQLGNLFRGIECREQVFFMTTPASGYAIKFLSQKGRVVIAATEADREVNATIFPVLLAEVLSNPPPAKEFDVDGDGRITLVDLYVAVSRRVLLAYAEAKNIPTEHALLDDNGDGRGSEVQLDYLEEELGGRRRAGPPPQAKQGQDGATAATIELGALLRGESAASPKPPTDKPPTDKPPTDKPPTDKPPTDKPPTDKPPTDKPSPDKPPTDKPPFDKPSPDKPPTDKPPTDKPPTDKPPADKPNTGQPQAGKPR